MRRSDPAHHCTEPSNYISVIFQAPHKAGLFANHFKDEEDQQRTADASTQNQIQQRPSGRAKHGDKY